ncbi:hypothetical protein [Streptomyces sp. NRRL B-24484]|uniref:hypothetical protein n=1 Tax=Streptomyces sp. NRRL B-24484 TaxID=1463833 RepID=UPI0004C14AAF|nr:hypothetical protein [Streptomyces sp. NRRL B-24484]
MYKITLEGGGLGISSLTRTQATLPPAFFVVTTGPGRRLLFKITGRDGRHFTAAHIRDLPPIRS